MEELERDTAAGHDHVDMRGQRQGTRSPSFHNRRELDNRDS